MENKGFVIGGREAKDKEFGTLVEGIYDAKIKEASIGKSKKGNDMMTVKYEVTGKKKDGKELTTTVLDFVAVTNYSKCKSDEEYDQKNFKIRMYAKRLGIMSADTYEDALEQVSNNLGVIEDAKVTLGIRTTTKEAMNEETNRMEEKEFENNSVDEVSFA